MKRACKLFCNVGNIPLKSNKMSFVSGESLRVMFITRFFVELSYVSVIVILTFKK